MIASQPAAAPIAIGDATYLELGGLPKLSDGDRRFIEDRFFVLSSDDVRAGRYGDRLYGFAIVDDKIVMGGVGAR